MITKAATVDVAVENHGTVWVFTPLTTTAHDWIKANVQIEAWQYNGASFVVDHRMARDLADGMVAEGLILK